MNLKCLAIDDEPHVLKKLIFLINQIHNLTLVLATTDPIEAQQYLLNNKIDLLITDIQMDLLSGFDLHEQFEEDCHVIFITGHTEMLVDALGKKVIDILTKPFNEITFNEAIIKSHKIISYDITEAIKKDYLAKYVQLTKIEKEVIQEYALGNKSKIIGEKTFKTTKTIDKHIENIKNKLQLKNSYEFNIFVHELSKII